MIIHINWKVDKSSETTTYLLTKRSETSVPFRSRLTTGEGGIYVNIDLQRLYAVGNYDNIIRIILEQKKAIDKCIQNTDCAPDTSHYVGNKT